MSGPPDSEELERFREAWKAEVRRKRADKSSHPEPQTLGESKPPRIQDFDEPPKSPLKHVEPPLFVPQSGQVPIQDLSQRTQDALQIYAQAVAHERLGNTDEALHLYRRAFRMEDRIDRIYDHQMSFIALGNVPHATDEVVKRLQAQLEARQEAHPGPVANVSRIVRAFPPGTAWFEMEDEKVYSLLKDMSEELVVHILTFLDHTSLERFAASCRTGRIITLDVAIWKEKVVAAYAPPQVADIAALKELMRNPLEYRRIYVEHPRVRSDGVYIAICHYVRHGHSENHWSQMTHLITYHRYLRFFPNGQVLSLLTNEEQYSPGDIIPILEPALRMKGFSVGTWSLRDSIVEITNLVEVSQRAARYVFNMTLSLQSRPMRGRWNRLDLLNYDTLNLDTGDLCPVMLKNERPFWFSKVKSYGSV